MADELRRRDREWSHLNYIDELIEQILVKKSPERFWTGGPGWFACTMHHPRRESYAWKDGRWRELTPVASENSSALIFKDLRLQADESRLCSNSPGPSANRHFYIYLRPGPRD